MFSTKDYYNFNRLLELPLPTSSVNKIISEEPLGVRLYYDVPNLAFNNFVYNGIHHHSLVDNIIYTDIKRVFDMIYHGVLIKLL